jgi:hypothetical protein
MLFITFLRCCRETCPNPSAARDRDGSRFGDRERTPQERRVEYLHGEREPGIGDEDSSDRDFLPADGIKVSSYSHGGLGAPLIFLGARKTGFRPAANAGRDFS